MQQCFRRESDSLDAGDHGPTNTMSNDKVDAAGNKVTEAVGNAYEATKEYIQEVMGVAETKTEEVKQEAIIVVDKAVDKTEQAVDTTKQKTSELMEKAKKDVNKAGDQAQAKMEECKEKMASGSKTEAAPAPAAEPAASNTTEVSK